MENLSPHSCPKCHSGATQSATMAVASGTSSWNGSMISAGFNGPNVGFGVGESQSNLAAALSPGTKPSWLTLAAGIGFAHTVLSCAIAPALAEGWHQAVCWVWLFGVVPLLLLRRRQARKRWFQALERFTYAWVCQSCGWIWKP